MTFLVRVKTAVSALKFGAPMYSVPKFSCGSFILPCRLSVDDEGVGCSTFENVKVFFRQLQKTSEGYVMVVLYWPSGQLVLGFAIE
jgi:hypothetical protein